MTSAQLCTSIHNNLDANSLFYLGMSQLQASQKAEARGVPNQALVAGLQEPLATEAKRALADLQAGVKRHLGTLLGVKHDRRPSECFVVSDYPAGRTPV